MSEDFKRYALYFAPESGSRLARLGNHWLGTDPETGKELDRPQIDEIRPQDIANITKTPSRYGFHGTLKPPFFLRENRTVRELDLEVKKLAAQISPFDVVDMVVRPLGDFLAIVPMPPVEALNELADRCVKELDDFRQPASDEELARRRISLTPQQESLLTQWGYPYVMEEFRFHMTLTGRLGSSERAKLEKKLTDYMAPALVTPVTVQNISLFGDPGDSKQFCLLKRYPLGGGGQITEI